MIDTIKHIAELWRVELSRIFKNKAAVVLIVGILILPSLYAWVNIQALWDPYAHTKELKVAVLSDDQTITVMGKSVNVGDQLITKLKKNHSLDWQLVKSYQEVKQGVKSGDYYAGIYLPKTFSKDLLSFTKGQVKKPDIEYLVNEKINAITPKVMKSGVGELQKQIESTFTKEVTEVLMTVFNQIGFNIDENWTDIQRVRSAILKADDNLDLLDQGVVDIEALQAKLPAIDKKLETAHQLAGYLPVIDLVGGQVVKLNQDMPKIMAAASIILKVHDKIPELQTAASHLQQIDSNMDAVQVALNHAVSVSSQVKAIVDQAVTSATSASGIAVIQDVKQKLETVRQEMLAVQAALAQIEDKDLPPNLKADIAAIIQSLTVAEIVLSDAENLDVVTLLIDIQTTVDGVNQFLVTCQQAMPAIKQEVHAVNSLFNDNIGLIIAGINTANDIYVNDLPQVAQKVQQTADFYQKDWPGIEKDLKATLAIVDDKYPLAKEVVNLSADFLRSDWPQIRQGIQKAAQAIRNGEKDFDIDGLLKALKYDATTESNFLANPVNVKTDTLYPIKNYGSQNVPFYTVLCFWVGAVLFASISSIGYRLDKRQETRGYTYREKYAARYLTYMAVALLQATIAILGDILLLRADIHNVPASLLFALLIAATFMSLIYLLVGLFGAIGEGAAIIILVLSIAAGGGNYPIEMTGQFFQVIHPFLPFTHAVTLMREAVGGIYPPTMWHALLILLVFALVSNVLNFALVPIIRPKVERFSKKLKATGLLEG
ncbi:MAG: YhgE/Pip domain-containing protein [Streptococcaceae bacterium]|jgi:YhgE/Pip-like protein|nr:YhgE/Pip domain-containing protein [Streptococcaceae bacterium]